MSPNDIRKLVDQQPFQPFRIHLADGKALDVHDPAYIIVTKFAIMLGEDFDDDGWPTSGRYVNIRQITQIETLPTAA